MLNLPKFKAAAVQAAPVFLDTDATVDKVCRLIKEAAGNGAKLVAFPEVFVAGLAGLTPVPSRLVKVPRVDESPVSFECRVSGVMQLNRADGSALDTWMVLGEVVGVHIDRKLVADGVYDTVAARPILRGGGLADYFEVSNETLFQMRRPA